MLTRTGNNGNLALQTPCLLDSGHCECDVLVVCWCKGGYVEERSCCDDDLFLR
jgi:hypothetical protein